MTGGVYRIGKTFKFEAAHRLPDLPEGHKCARTHGHSYRVEVWLATPAPLTRPGFVVDFAELAPLGAHIDAGFDHRDLNVVLEDPPTSEHLARYFYIYDWCAQHLPLPPGVEVEKVRVSETASTFAEYEAIRS